MATDINPPSVTLITSPGFTPYVAPDTVTNVRYKYKWRFQPYTVASFKFRPSLKVDRLFMHEFLFNIDQFKSFFYLDVTYYQLAHKYTYPSSKDSKQPDPTQSLPAGGTTLAPGTPPPDGY